MAEPKPLASAYGAKPSALPNPVAPQGAQDEVAQWMASVQPAQVNAPAPTGTPAPQDEVSAWMAQQETVPADPQLGAEYAPEPGFIETNANSLSNFKDRLLQGLSANPKEAQGALEAKYGKENVRFVGEKLRVRKPGSKQFTVLEPAAFDILNDLLTDNARSFAQEGFMLPNEALGGLGGTALGGPAGGVAGGLGGRMAATPGSIQFADELAQAAGVPQDPTRDKTSEAHTQMAFELLGPAVGKAMKFAKRFIPGTTEAVERASLKQAQKAEYVLAEESAQHLATIKELEDGALKGVMGGQPLLSPDQLNPRNALAKTSASLLRNTPELQNFYVEQGKAIKSVVMDNLALVARKTGKGLVPDGELGKVIGDAASDLATAEGRQIGAYKALAQQTLGNKKTPLSQGLLEKTAELANAFNFVPQETKRIAVRPGTASYKSFELPVPNRTTFRQSRDMNNLLGTLGITDSGQMTAFSNKLKDVLDTMGRGELNLAETERLINTVGDMTTVAKRNGGKISQQWSGLASELRTYRRGMIENALPDDTSKKGFKQVMDSFSANYDSIRDIAESINTNMGANAVVRSVFNKGPEALGDIRAIKTVLAKSHPEAWNNLRSEWISGLSEKYLKGDKPDYAGFVKVINGKGPDGLGEEVLKEIWDGAGSSRTDLMRYMELGKRALETQIDAGPIAQSEGRKLMKDASKLMWASKYLGLDAMANMLQLGAKQNAIRDILTREGAEQYLTSAPPQQRAWLSNRFSELAEYSRMNRIPESLRAIPAKLGTREYIQSPASQTGGGAESYFPEVPQ